MFICRIKNLFKAMEFLTKIGIDFKKNYFCIYFDSKYKVWSEFIYNLVSSVDTRA